jgi:DNA-binding response OmpR family regulator
LLNKLILVVDDDVDVRELVSLTLKRAGFDTTCAAEGREALRLMYGTQPAGVVLDIGMPDLDGWQTLDRIRDVSDVPVLFLTAHDTEFEKVRGLRSGADDYVTKPFSRAELVARTELLLRRHSPKAEVTPVIDDGRVRIDIAQRTVLVDGNEVTLTPLEFRLLATFVRHPNQVLSRDQLLQLVWDDAGVGSGDQVKLYVGYLRRKLAAVSNADLIDTVRGFGYRYRPPERVRFSAARQGARATSTALPPLPPRSSADRSA